MTQTVTAPGDTGNDAGVPGRVRMRSSLWWFIAKRIAITVPMLLAITLIVFVLTRIAPGDPIDVLLGDFPATPEYRAELRERYGLDRPLIAQYFSYLGNLVQGDLGFSLRNRAPVSDLVLDRLPATLLLMGSGMALATVIGVGSGIVASLRPYSIADNTTTLFSVIGFAAPVFWMGQMLLVLASRTGWFPLQGMTSIRGDRLVVIDVAWHLILPALTVSFRYSAINARMTRASLTEAMRQDYIVTAQAKGLRRSTVVLRHGLRNALLPVVTVIGYNFGFVLSGSVLVETVFSWPGIGRLLFESLGARDTPTMMGIFLIGGAMALIANTLTDILYSILDPRIRNG